MDRMTREEAIKYIKSRCIGPTEERDGTQWSEAMWMAIEALQAKTDVDLISRQDAIDILDDFESDIELGKRDSYKTHREKLLSLPSAEPKTKCIAQIKVDRDDIEDLINEKINEIADKISEQKTEWIPVSERLPDEFGEYLVTNKTIGWNYEEYNSNDIAYFDNEGFHKADKVIAWMPLPEPYKEGGA